MTTLFCGYKEKFRYWRWITTRQAKNVIREDENSENERSDSSSPSSHLAILPPVSQSIHPLFLTSRHMLLNLFSINLYPVIPYQKRNLSCFPLIVSYIRYDQRFSRKLRNTIINSMHFYWYAAHSDGTPWVKHCRSIAVYCYIVIVLWY